MSEPIRILVVDDNVDAAESLAMLAVPFAFGQVIGGVLDEH